MMKTKIWLASSVMVASIGLIATGCGKSEETPAPGQANSSSGTNGNSGKAATAYLGLVASQNGDLKPWGVDEVKGANLALKEFNDAGGLGDGKIAGLKIEDSNSDPKTGKSAAEKLMSESVVGLVGEVASGITAQMAEAAIAKGVPIVAVGATKTELTALGPNIFRVCYTDAFQGPVMARFAYEQLGLRKVGIMTDQKQPYSIGLSDSFKKSFTKLGGEVVDEQKYESAQTQFNGQLTNLKSKNPEGLFLSGYFTEVGQIARQARDAGITGPLLGGDGWDSRELVNLGGDAIIGGYYCNHYNNHEDRPEVKAFLDKWNKEYGDSPGTTMGALGYDATKLVLEALKKCKDYTPAELAKNIEATTDFVGVSGKITLAGKKGNPEKRALVVKVTKNGDEFVKAYEWFPPEN